MPGSVTVPAGQSSAEFRFTARGVGETVIRAQIGGEPARVAVVTAVQIVDGLSLPDAHVGEPALGTLTLVAPAPEAFDVQLGSSDTVVATVPATLTVPAGSASVEVLITPVGAGTARITVAFGAFEVSADLTVGERSRLAGLSVPPVYAGLVATGQVELAAAASEETVVQIASGDTGVVTVAATATVPAGEMSGTFAITPVGEGATTITATLDGAALTSDVTVGGFVQDIDDPVLHPLVEGQQVGVAFATTAPAPLTLGVAVDSAIVSVPATVGVGHGELGISIPITVSGSGSFTLTVTLNGATYAETLTVSPLLKEASCVCPVVEGRGTTATVRLNAAPANAFNILLSSDNPAVASVPTGMAVAAGASSGELTVSANSPGTATITATWNGESVTLLVEVVANALSATGPAGAITVGESDDTAFVSLAVAAGADPVVVTVTVGDEAIVDGPGTVTIPVGSTGAGIVLTGLSAGTTTVTVRANGQTASFEVVVEEP